MIPCERSRALGGAYWGQAQEDWAAGENAADWSEEAIHLTRRHFVSHVRPAGPLSAVRIARQPYGVLPVLPLDAWHPASGEERYRVLARVLRVLRDRVWLPAAARMPQVGAHRRQTVSEAQDALIRILATSPLSQAIYAREHIGPDYLASLWRYARMQLQPDWQRVLRLTSARLLIDLGVGWSPRLMSMVAASASAPVTTALISADEEATDTRAYLTWLSSPDRRWKDLATRPEWTTDARATPLLYRLARHSALCELSSAATRVQLRQGTLGDWEHLDAELIGLRLQGDPPSTASQLERKLRFPDGTDGTLGEYIAGPIGATDPDVEMGSYRAGAAALAAYTAERLEQTLRSTLDAVSHRLDAWITSFATARLQGLRKEHPTGLALGGFGWVEHLIPRDVPGMQRPISAGYIHAPSLQQAVTAGVLCSGYLSHSGDGRNPFAVNLSSERIRTARHVLEAVRNGQPLSAVAGYLFERALHEHGVDEYLDNFRSLAPVRVTEITTDATEPTEAVLPSAVADGMALRSMWRANPAKLMSDARVTPASRSAVEQVLKLLDEALDATADALVTESVHHAVSGNPSRAAATLDAAARGDGAVPQLEYVRTARSGMAITHRVALVTQANATAHWGLDAPTSLRRTASPAFEALAAALLPSPYRVRCTVQVDGGSGIQQMAVRLSECALSALDAVYGVPAAQEPGSEVPAILALAVAETVRQRYCLANDVPLTFGWKREADWLGDDLTFGELTSMVRLVRAVLRRCRPLRGADLVPAEVGCSLPPGEDLTLTDRADAIAAVLRSAITLLDHPATRVQGMRAAVELGAHGAAESLLLGTADPQVASAVQMELEKRARALADIEAEPATPHTNARNIRRIQAVLGGDFLPLPKVAQQRPEAFAADLAHGDKLLGTEPTGARRWLQKVGRVRPAIAALERLRIAGKAIGIPSMPMRVAQRPFVAGEPWVGHIARTSGPRVNVALLAATTIEDTKEIAGLLLDEWIEVVGASEQTTGIAFHFDTPGSQAPQSILLAVAPDPTTTVWTPDLVEHAVLDALEIAKIRMVDPEALEEVGQVLPALYIPNVVGDPASTDVLPP